MPIDTSYEGTNDTFRLLKIQYANSNAITKVSSFNPFNVTTPFFFNNNNANKRIRKRRKN